jgi:hypothetical protein
LQQQLNLMNKPSTERPTTNIDVVDDGQSTLMLVLQNRFANMEAGEARALLETTYGASVWTSAELMDVFEVSHFEPPYVHVIRKKDGARGTVVFIDAPRLYFSFQPLKNYAAGH